MNTKNDWKDKLEKVILDLMLDPLFAFLLWLNFSKTLK